MRSILTGLGIDYDQWKALTIAALKLDLRTSRLGGFRTGSPGGKGRSSKAAGTRAILGRFAFYIFMGFFMAYFVWFIGDRFLAATALFTYLILMVGLAMLMDHNAAITSPEDYEILGFQPITSRTFFASKVTNALVYTLGITTALGLLPLGVFFFKEGVAVGAGALLALYLCATGVTLAVVAVYGTLLRWAGAKRLRSWLSYVQFAIGFLVYGGFFLTSEMVSKSTLAGLTLERTSWLSLLPPTWFASYLEVAAGSTLLQDVGPILASLALLAALTTQLRGRLSLEYAGRIGELSSATAPAPDKSRSRPKLWFQGGEGRAAAILIRSHFRNDLRFRMGVLGIVPITVIYLIIGFRNGMEASEAGEPGQGLSLVTMAVLMFPMMLKIHLAHSESFQASWVFFATPTDRTKLISSSKNVLVVNFLIPYLAVLGVTLAFMTHNLLWVATYLVLAGSVSHLGLMVVTVVNPELPFSKEATKGGNSSRMLLIMMVIGVAGAVLPIISRMVLGKVVPTVLAFGTILAITLALVPITRRRVQRQSGYLEFLG